MTTRTDDTLAVSRWDDPVLAQLGWPVGGRYMRWTWSSLLGPTATQLVILLDEVVTDSGQVTFNYCALSATLGVKPSVLARAIGRLERFHMVRVDWPTRRRTPPRGRCPGAPARPAQPLRAGGAPGAHRPPTPTRVVGRATGRHPTGVVGSVRRVCPSCHHPARRQGPLRGSTSVSGGLRRRRTRCASATGFRFLARPAAVP